MSECNGEGTCSAARLHIVHAKCRMCGGESFDHDTDKPDEPYCLTCGEDAAYLLRELWGTSDV